jgi:hypothetical protein
MSRESRDLPIYAPLFTEGAFQDWLDRTAGDYLHHFLGTGAESPIMDRAFGLGHRLKAGHDLQGSWIWLRIRALTALALGFNTCSPIS